MEMSPRIVAAFSMAILVLALSVYGQPGLPCTPAMVNSFTPCLNYLNNATANSTTPTPDCCNSLKSITTNSSGCLCLLFSGTVPFPITINRTLAISLPQACSMPGVAVQCNKASTTAPVSAPGPAPVALSPPPSITPSPVSPSTPDTNAPPSASGPAATPGVSGPAASTTPATTTPASGSGGATAPSSATPPASSANSLVMLGVGMLFIAYS